MGKTSKIAWFLIILLIVSFIVSSVLGFFVSGMEFGNIAVIDVDGFISTGSDESILQEDITSDYLIEMLNRADEDPEIEAVILNINSPGSTPVAADEVGQRIKHMGKPVISVIRDIGTSGAYWIASSTDHIIANRMSMIGSIGVRASYLEFAGFLEDHNITYQELKSGEFKEIGNPFRELSFDEKEFYLTKLQKIHQFFIEEVAYNRNMSVQRIEEMADGQFFLGYEGEKNGLIDELGGMPEAEEYLNQKLNITVEGMVEYKKETSWASILFDSKSDAYYSVGQGIGDSLKAEKETEVLLR